MAHKVDLEVGGVIENMAAFVTPSGERFQLFGEGGGQELADELDVPPLAKVPLTLPLRAPSDAGPPLVFTHPGAPGAQAGREAARRRVAQLPGGGRRGRCPRARRGAAGACSTRPPRRRAARRAWRRST